MQSNKAMSTLTLGAIGVVFGDIGTSPLYALKEIFNGHHPMPVNPENILGIGYGETTSDGLITLKEGECMGACGDAPVFIVNNRSMCSHMHPELIDKQYCCGAQHYQKCANKKI